jgi:hypothetical protein
MRKLLAGSLLLLCISGTWAIGCSSDKAPANASSGGSGGIGGGGGIGGNTQAGDTSTGGSDTSATMDTTPCDTEVKTVSPDDSTHLMYSGRIDFTDPTKPVYSAPGVVVSARFKGTSVSVMLKDSFKGQNYFEVVIDRDPAKTYIFQPKTTLDTYDVVSDLPCGEHLVEFVKRTEASQGTVTFLGLKLGGTLLAAPAHPTRKIEIIGDSICAGSGIEPGANQAKCGSSDTSNENAYLTYGALLARALDAEYHITAAGGRGAMRNYECGRPDTLPAVYDLMHINDMNSIPWNYTTYVPDAILVGLGTNDFSPDQCNKPPLSLQCDPMNYQLFITAMEQFINKLHGYYPEAQIIMTSSPMLTDGWPDPVSIDDAGTTCPYTSRTSHVQALHTILEDMQSDGGGSYVHLIDTIPKYAGRGCGTHPNTTEHALIAGGNPNELLNPFKAIMGW